MLRSDRMFVTSRFAGVAIGLWIVWCLARDPRTTVAGAEISGSSWGDIMCHIRLVMTAHRNICPVCGYTVETQIRLRRTVRSLWITPRKISWIRAEGCGGLTYQPAKRTSRRRRVGIVYSEQSVISPPRSTKTASRLPSFTG